MLHAFCLEEMIPENHLLRLIDRYVDFGFVRERLRSFYSEIGRPSVDPQRHFLNVLKHLSNELQIPITAIGTHDAFNAVHTDPQLANRFEPALLPRWTMGNDYLRLLASFEVSLNKSRARFSMPVGIFPF